MTRAYSAKQAAKQAGIHWVTLHRWLAAGKVRPSTAIRTNGSTFYRWTPADVAALRAYKGANYRKGRGRKKGSQRAHRRKSAGKK